MTDRLNARAHELACQVIQNADDLRATCHDLPGGGRIVATGTPEQLAQDPNSYTGRYLQKALEKTNAPAPEPAPAAVAN